MDRYPRILPAPPSPDETLDQASNNTGPVGKVVLPPKREPALAACGQCRRKKTKCNAQRPSCGRCLGLELECLYDTNENETILQALKRKCSALEREVAELRQLLSFLRHRPLEESQEVFLRIRNVDDPLSVLRTVKDAEMILAAPQVYSAQSIDGESNTNKNPSSSVPP